MRSSADGKGYLTTVLIDITGVRRTIKVHRMICVAWHGPSNGRQTNHLDGNKKNNHVKNLAWSTGVENMQHAYHVLGRKNYRKKDGLQPNAKLDLIQVKVIREVAYIYSLVAIANYFHVTRKSIQNIKAGVTWRNS